MVSSDRNLLYRRPELYELLYPDPDEAGPTLCRRLFARYLPTPPASVLDLGCGTGRDLAALARAGPPCWGVDALPEMIAYGRARRPNLRLEVGDMRAVRLGRTFDAVLCLGSALLYALTDEDLTRTLATFAAHAHPGTLLVLALLNAAAFLGDGAFRETVESTLTTPELTATAVATHRLDRRRQRLVRRRVWHLPGAPPEADVAEYRLLFPAELEHRLAEHGFWVAGMFDNLDLQETDLAGPQLYVAALH